MASTPVERFLGNPSEETLEQCWKDDLLALAVHFGIKVARGLLERLLKEEVFI